MHTRCDLCGEQIGTLEPRAELYNLLMAKADIIFSERMAHMVVHAEPCATELIARGWEIA